MISKWAKGKYVINYDSHGVEVPGPDDEVDKLTMFTKKREDIEAFLGMTIKCLDIFYGLPIDFVILYEKKTNNFVYTNARIKLANKLEKLLDIREIRHDL